MILREMGTRVGTGNRWNASAEEWLNSKEDSIVLSEKSFPIGSGPAKSTVKDLLQSRMKRQAPAGRMMAPTRCSLLGVSTAGTTARISVGAMQNLKVRRLKINPCSHPFFGLFV